VNHRWNVWVLQYSQGEQMQLMRSIGWPTPSWSDLGQLLGGALGLLGMGAGLAAWLSRDRQRPTPWQALNQRVHHALESLGLPAPVGASPASASSWSRALYELARTTSHDAKAQARWHPALLEALLRDLGRLDAWQYGPPLDTEAVKSQDTWRQARALVRQLERRCRQATSNPHQAGANSAN
jgi:hypothetical protein